MSDEKLELRYIPLDQARRWDDNPKKHDLPALIKSIETHGFGDPPKYDAALGALVTGNGRTEALEQMRAEGKVPPRGIAVLEGGQWAMPILFGVDAASRAAAVAFAIDHNNLTLLGGGLGFTDLLAIWDEQGLQKVLADVPDASKFLASLDSQDLDSLIHGPSFEPAALDDQSRLDQNKMITCPECGHEFRPRK
ncbi:MAG: hypothetical protein HC897_13045 [Thermoanaerobaculia bacterium]|nr:hypothetical protein [Thermoanaerobaculia bacterium]